MDDLLALVAAKKREVSAIRAEKQSLQDKYLRREQVEHILETQQDQVAASSVKKPLKKRRLERQEDARIDSGDTQTNEQDTKLKQDAEVKLSWVQLSKRLRELGQPITLFGEGMTDRMTRLRAAEHDAVSKRDDALDERQKVRNVFVGHNDNEDDEQDAEDRDEQRQNERTKDEEEMATASGADGTSSKEEADDELKIYHFLKGMLRRWENDLSHRPDAVKRTAQGKQAAKTMKQCKDYIRPLFRLCKKHQVPRDILPNLVEIVRFCEQGEFVQAHDAYIRLAIGNAAWPIGVTMVGIHERTGREKINANKQAHVMNNEAQRKYITSVKRLISYAQSISHALPSKKVM